MRLKFLYSLLGIACVFVIQSCSSTKFIEDGQYWLRSATIKSDTKGISSLEMEAYIQQKPNFKTLEIFRMPLFIYNLSGSDTTKWVNRVLRNAGEAPVIYDSTTVDNTVNNLTTILNNKGYIHAQVIPEIKKKGKTADIKYQIKAGQPYRITDYSINISDTVFENDKVFSSIRRRHNAKDTVSFNLDKSLLRNSLVQKNSLFDLDMLDEERDRVSSSFRRFGYYEFDKEYIGFVADTLTQGKDKVSLELTVYPYMQKRENGEIIESKHRQFVVKEVNFYVDYNPLEDINIGNYKPTEVVERDNGLYKIFYGEKGRYIKPHIILNSCFITPGALYSENATSTTYNSLSQLHILRNVNIRYQEIIDNDSTKLLCIITCVPDKKQAISVEAEGTNSDGRFGVGASIGYTHRNLFRGSELFNAKLRGSYEAISADFSNFDKNYFEIGGETSITFPRFMFPFLKRDLRRRLHASTQLTANYTYQRRPDYFTRTILSTRLSYLWQNRRNNSIKHSVDLVNVSYVHIPESKLNMSFINKLTSAAREFSFTDQFILGSGYTYTNTNLNLFSSKRRRQTSIYSLRANVETAGNLLSLVAAMAGAEKDSLGSKKIFGTRFVQYVLGNVDYSRTIYLDEKNSIAWRVGGGVVYPYGNYKMVPIQKRFYSGGANSVRGWGIRELGPGSFYKPDATFYDQSGEIRFDANIEYRSKVFWKFELAAFLDAGNIWTIKKYEEQEKGNFSFGSFYKEIAFAWGLGLRLDFDYVLIRLDCGWKLYDPADRYKHYDYDDNTRQWIPDAGRGMKSKWPVLKPFDIGHNTAWHIAVGYPF